MNSIDSNLTNQSIVSSPSISTFTILSGTFIILTGLAGQIGSIIVIFLIATNKSLRSKCFRLICGGAVGSFLVASSYFGVYVDKIGMATGLFRADRIGYECILRTGFLVLTGVSYHALTTGLVGIDRLLSLLTPIKYRTFGTRYVTYNLLACALFVVILNSTGIGVSPLFKIFVCVRYSVAVEPTFMNTFAGMNLFLCAANALIYILMLLCFWYRTRKIRGATDDYNAFIQNQSAAMPTVRLMAILYFFTGIIPEILINIALKYNAADQWVIILSFVANFFKCASSLVEIVSLSICSEKFRESLCALLKIRQNIVTDITYKMDRSGTMNTTVI